MGRDIRSFFSIEPSKKKQRTTMSSISECFTEDVSKNSSDTDEKEIHDVAKPCSFKDQMPEEKENAVTVSNATISSSTKTTTTRETTTQLYLHSNLKENLAYLMDPTWYMHLETEFQQPYFQRLISFLQQEEKNKKKIFPSPQDVFACLRDSSFDTLKVVILGQDPYHGPDQAHGLCFSVQKGIPPPPSLKNIYKEAMQDVKIKKPSHGCLNSWSQQGVLLLNTVLTVRRGEANSHKNQGWEKLTDAIIRMINIKTENVVFLLWGKPAQEN
jgi:uracil-DNA glycosylase